MKILIYVLIALAAGLIIYNLTFLDFSDPMAGESAAALVSLVAGLRACPVPWCWGLL